jgi:hypothetical protein
MIRKAMALSLALLLAACGGSSMMVLEPVKAPAKTDTAELTMENNTVGVPDEAIARTKEYMREEFFTGKKAVFREGKGGIGIRYGYIGYKEGSRVGRYFLGPLANSNAKMVLRAEFFDAAGNKIGEVQSQGDVGGGFFGGSHNSAIKRAVREIADYARATFR